MWQKCNTYCSCMRLREKLKMMAMCRGQSSQSAKASAGEEGTKSTAAEVEDSVHKLREQEEPEEGHRTVEGQIDDAIDDELNEFEKGQCYVRIIVIIITATTTTTIIIIIIIIVVVVVIIIIIINVILTLRKP